MKLIKFFTIICAISVFFSCGSEEEVVSNTVSKKMPEAAKTEEMTNFRNSLILMMKFRHSDEGKTVTDPEKIKEAQQSIILADAKNLLIANRVDISSFKVDSPDDNSKIIEMALKLYTEKTKISNLN